MKGIKNFFKAPKKHYYWQEEDDDESGPTKVGMLLTEVVLAIWRLTADLPKLEDENLDEGSWGALKTLAESLVLGEKSQLLRKLSYMQDYNSDDF